LRKFCTSACQIAIIVPATLESPPQPLGRDPIVQLQRAHTWESCAVLIFAAGRSVLIPSQLSRFSCALGPLCLVLLVVPRHYDDHTRDACKEVKCCVSQYATGDICMTPGAPRGSGSVQAQTFGTSHNTQFSKPPSQLSLHRRTSVVRKRC
jgi:hypothetical protein